MPLDNKIHETLFRKSDKEKIISTLNGVLDGKPQDYSGFNVYELKLLGDLMDVRIKAFEDKINYMIKEFGYLP
jgi:hypothetical protein